MSSSNGYRFSFRPIGSWSAPITDRRAVSPFNAGWPATAALLRREVRAISTDRYEVVIVIELDVPEHGIRQSGELRAGAAIDSPRCAVSFDSLHGPLRYMCDRFTSPRDSRTAWQANCRAIALGLDALRRVERYGIASRGEQYTGWQAIGSGIVMGARVSMTEDEALRIIGCGADVTLSRMSSRDEIKAAFRDAANLVHPDRGGNADTFKRLVEARDLLIPPTPQGAHT